MSVVKKPSLKDIAAKVGVSTALVSYVLNNQKQGRIGQEVAQKIRDAALSLNYRTNLIARSLKTNSTLTIGLMVPDISHPFFAGIARSVEDEANRHGYTVCYGSTDGNPLRSRHLMDMLLNRQVDGLIIAPGEHAEMLIKSLQEQALPFVLVDRYYPDLPSNYVALDNYKAAYIAVQHLVERGYKRIGLLGYETPLHHLNERKRGYLTALKDYKIAFTNSWLKEKGWVKEVSIANKKIEIERAVDELRLAREPVDSILFTSNRLAAAGVKHIHSLRLNVPEDLALVCFDETESLDLFQAPLTYLRQPLAEMGQQATRVLLDSIRKNNKIIQVNMEPELVIRKSTLKK